MSMKGCLNEKDFAAEFAKRSLDNLEKYEGDYDVTMLITSLIGLLVIPRESFFVNGVPEKAISREFLSHLQSCVEDNSRNGEEVDTPPSFDGITRAIRNAVCHGGIEFDGEKSNYTQDPFVVKRIRFTNRYRDDYDNDILFKILLTIDDVKEIVKAIYAKM